MKNLTIIIALLSLLPILVSCKKYDEEFIGAPLGMAPDNFSATPLTASNDAPDFRTESVFFLSTFNTSVNWTLMLTGQSSGAEKIIEGFSDGLKADNAAWSGTTDTTKIFQSGEKVTVALSILGWDQTLITEITIGHKKNHGTELGLFENISINHGSKNFRDATGLWWFYSFEPNEYDAVEMVADPLTPQGNYALRLAGHDANQSYYIGQAGLSAPSGAFNFGPTNIDNFYINLYIKGSGDGTSASGKTKDYKLVMQTYEDDNNDGTLQYDGSEDKYTYTISLAYDGWKLHSVKYSDFILEDAIASNNYRSHSPDKIANMGFFIGASTSSGLSSTDIIDTRIDMLTVTTNGPLIP